MLASKMTRLVAGSLFAVGFAIMGSALAQGAPLPPPEAFTACEGKNAGDGCAATMRGGHTERGTCMAAPDDGRLFCRPARPPGPPPEAVDACKGKSAAETCTVTFGDRTLSGTCVAGADGRLACHP
jgi:hypothetical protein